MMRRQTRQQKVTWLVAAALSIGIVGQPAAATDIPNDAGTGQGLANYGSARSGCAADGTSQVISTVAWPNTNSFFEIGNMGSAASVRSYMYSAFGALRMCGQLSVASSDGSRYSFAPEPGQPMRNPGTRCVMSHGQGTIRWNSPRNQTYWLRNVRSHGDVLEGAQHLIGEVVLASSAAEAAATTAHHYIHMQIRGSGCYIGLIETTITYQIVDKNLSALPPLCETSWQHGCLYGTGPL